VPKDALAKELSTAPSPAMPKVPPVMMWAMSASAARQSLP